MYGCAFHVVNDGHVCTVKQGHGPYLCVLRRAERDRVGGCAYALFCLVSWEYTQHTQTSKRHIVPFSHFSPFLLIWLAAEARGKELRSLSRAVESQTIFRITLLYLYSFGKGFALDDESNPVENTINPSGVRRREPSSLWEHRGSTRQETLSQALFGKKSWLDDAGVSEK